MSTPELPGSIEGEEQRQLDRSNRNSETLGEESENQEILFEKEGNVEIKTTIIIRQNTDGTTSKETIKEYKNPDGTSTKDVKYEPTVASKIITDLEVNVDEESIREVPEVHDETASDDHNNNESAPHESNETANDENSIAEVNHEASEETQHENTSEESAKENAEEHENAVEHENEEHNEIHAEQTEDKSEHHDEASEHGENDENVKSEEEEIKETVTQLVNETAASDENEIQEESAAQDVDNEEAADESEREEVSSHQETEVVPEAVTETEKPNDNSNDSEEVKEETAVVSAEPHEEEQEAVEASESHDDGHKDEQEEQETLSHHEEESNDEHHQEQETSETHEETHDQVSSAVEALINNVESSLANEVQDEHHEEDSHGEVDEHKDEAEEHHSEAAVEDTANEEVSNGEQHNEEEHHEEEQHEKEHHEEANLQEVHDVEHHIDEHHDEKHDEEEHHHDEEHHEEEHKAEQHHEEEKSEVSHSEETHSEVVHQAQQEEEHHEEKVHHNSEASNHENSASKHSSASENHEEPEAEANQNANEKEADALNDSDVFKTETETETEVVTVVEQEQAYDESLVTESAHNEEMEEKATEPLDETVTEATLEEHEELHTTVDENQNNTTAADAKDIEAAINETIHDDDEEKTVEAVEAVAEPQAEQAHAEEPAEHQVHEDKVEAGETAHEHHEHQDQISENDDQPHLDDKTETTPSAETSEPSNDDDDTLNNDDNNNTTNNAEADLIVDDEQQLVQETIEVIKDGDSEIKIVTTTSKNEDGVLVKTIVKTITYVNGGKKTTSITEDAPKHSEPVEDNVNENKKEEQPLVANEHVVIQTNLSEAKPDLEPASLNISEEIKQVEQNMQDKKAKKLVLIIEKKPEESGQLVVNACQVIDDKIASSQPVHLAENNFSLEKELLQIEKLVEEFNSKVSSTTKPETKKSTSEVPAEYRESNENLPAKEAATTAAPAASEKTIKSTSELNNFKEPISMLVEQFCRLNELNNVAQPSLSTASNASKSQATNSFSSSKYPFNYENVKQYINREPQTYSTSSNSKQINECYKPVEELCADDNIIECNHECDDLYTSTEDLDHSIKQKPKLRVALSATEQPSVKAEHADVKQAQKYLSPLYQFKEDYHLNTSQFNLVVVYFDHLQNESGYIETKALTKHLLEASASRKEIRATESDLKHALAVIDRDNDGKISFQEFLDFISLFYASKFNLKKKLNSILTSHRDDHSNKNGTLNKDEAFDFLNFAFNFYGKALPQVYIDEYKTLDAYQAADLSITYEDFSKKAYKSLEPILFVKW